MYGQRRKSYVIQQLRRGGFSRAAVLIALTTLLNACHAVPEQARKMPNTRFHVIGETRLHSDMRSMAVELGVLLDIHLNEAEPEPMRQQRALAALDRIDIIASGIGGDGIVSNYSIINDYMSAFLYDVGIARQFARKNPPNYFPGGRLIKSCMSCHESF